MRCRRSGLVGGGDAGRLGGGGRRRAVRTGEIHVVVGAAPGSGIRGAGPFATGKKSGGCGDCGKNAEFLHGKVARGNPDCGMQSGRGRLYVNQSQNAIVFFVGMRSILCRNAKAAMERADVSWYAAVRA